MEKLLDNPGGCKGRLEGKIIILEFEGLSSAYRFHDAIFKIPQDRNEDERNSKNTQLHASFLGTKMAKERQGNKLKREELRKFRGDEGTGAKELPC